MNLDQVYRASKHVVRFPGWSDPNGTNYVHFDAPLEIGGIVEHGLFLHGGCYLDQPDRHVSIAIRIARISGRQHIELSRIDWRPIDGGHTNPRGRCAFSGRIEGSHAHVFEDNYNETAGKMKSGLRCARPVDPEPSSFQELMKSAGILFRVKNMDIVEPPGWSYRLDLGDGYE